MSTNSIFSVIGWLGGAFFCGVLPLGFAAILYFTARKRGRVGAAASAARRGPIVAVKPGPGLARLQGQVAPQANAIDGAPENALVYLRMKVEVYRWDSDSSGWVGLTDKARGIPFQLQDNSGTLWVTPDGLDKQLLGSGFVPNENQVQAACILLGISPNILRGQLRYQMWELRAGQTLTVIGSVLQGQKGLEIRKAENQPLIISPLPGQTIDAQISSQTKKASTWAMILGIPGAILLVCGLGGALVALVRMLTAK